MLFTHFSSLFRLARNHRPALIWACLFSGLAGILGLVPFLVIAEIGWAYTQHSTDRVAIIHLAEIAGAALVVRCLMVAASKVLSHIAAFKTMYDLQIKLAEKIAVMPLGEVTGRGANTIKKTMLQDTDIAHTIIGHYLTNIVTGLVVPAVTILVFFAMDWRIALAACAVLPFLYMAYRAAFGNYSTELDSYFRADDRMQSSIIEYITNIQVIKTYNRDLLGVLRERVTEQVCQSIGWAQRTMLPWSTFNILSDVGLVFILPAGLWLAMIHKADVQAILVFLLLGIGYLQPLVRLSVQIGFLNRAAKSLGRIEAILEAPEVSGCDVAATPADNGISIDHVGFSHIAGETCLHEVTLTIPEGSVCAFVGPSGAGKSTLAQLIGRYWDVETGSISIGGVDLRSMSEAELYRRISFVFQDVFLFRGTIEDNLKLANPEATESEMIEAARAARAHDFIMALPQGYKTPIGNSGHLLSGGQHQRISIARALLRDAPILILDEATAYADPINEAEIQKALGVLMRNRTVIIIAHRLSTIVNADIIAVLDKGRLVAAANHGTLQKTCPLYASLWKDYAAHAPNGLACDRDPASTHEYRLAS